MGSLLLTDDVYYSKSGSINSGDRVFTAVSKIQELSVVFLSSGNDEEQIAQLPMNELADIQRADNTYGHALVANTPGHDIDTNIDDYITKPVRDFLELATSKLDKKIRNLLANKTTTFEKQLESYGVIDSITWQNGKSIISARIYDQDTDEILDNIDFDAKEFTPSDQKLLVENAVFYWRVGQDHNFLGGYRNVSEFRIRRRITRTRRINENNPTADAIVDYFNTVFKNN